MRKAGVGRRPWAHDRVHKVAACSMWKRRHPSAREVDERWKVTARFRFETGNGDILAVRIHCFRGAGAGRIVNMSEARLMQQFVEAGWTMGTRRRNLDRL